MSDYERIINLMNPNGAGSSTLEQHCAAMRMDHLYAVTFNRLNYAIYDVECDIKRLKDPIGDLDKMIAQVADERAARQAAAAWSWDWDADYWWHREPVWR